MNKILTKKDYERAFGEKLSELVLKSIEENPVEYVELPLKEKEKIIIHILEHLEDDSITRAGPKRIGVWNAGWGENLKLITDTNNFKSLIPKYFGKYKYIRFCGEFIETINKEAEYNTVKVLQTWLFEKFFENSSNIYEFGCGTGHNLFRANKVNKDAKIFGLDWSDSSKEIFQQINNNFDKDFSFKQFDFFNVDKSFKIKENSGVYTFAALEQSGEKFKDFIDYLVDNNVKNCVHVEPIAEMLDTENSLNDYLSAKYFKKRNYLSGLKKYLKKIENEGRIEILTSQKSNVGSLYIEGYSIIAWRSINA